MNQHKALEIMETLIVNEMDRVSVSITHHSHPNFPDLKPRVEYIAAIGSVYGYGDDFKGAIEDYKKMKKTQLSADIMKLEKLLKEHNAQKGECNECTETL